MPDHQSHLPVRDVDARGAHRLIAEGATVLDVREPYEWADAHIEGSVLIPLGRLQVGSVPSGRPVVVVCRSGRRSAAAVQALQSAGRDDVVNLAGGVLAWASAGLPLVREGAGARR